MEANECWVLNERNDERNERGHSKALRLLHANVKCDARNNVGVSPVSDALKRMGQSPDAVMNQTFNLQSNRCMTRLQASQRFDVGGSNDEQAIDVARRLHARGTGPGA